jgi:hypothetical protein
MRNARNGYGTADQRLKNAPIPEGGIHQHGGPWGALGLEGAVADGTFCASKKRSAGEGTRTHDLSHPY